MPLASTMLEPLTLLASADLRLAGRRRFAVLSPEERGRRRTGSALTPRVVLTGIASRGAKPGTDIPTSTLTPALSLREWAGGRGRRRSSSWRSLTERAV